MVDRILSLARELAAAHDAKQYSYERNAYTRLLDAVRQTPAWMLPALVEPAAEVVRELSCGTQVTLRNDDGNLVLVVRDHDGEVLAPVLTAEEGAQMRSDLQRVLAATLADNAGNSVQHVGSAAVSLPAAGFSNGGSR